LQKREGFGFQSSKEDMVSEKIEELVKNEVKRTFNPEFLNRLDEIILFNALSETDLIQILELMVNQLNANLAQKAITVTVADEAKKWILNQTLTDRTYGARPLRRALQKYIEDPLSEALIQGTITVRPAFIEVFLEDNKLFYRPVDAEKTSEGVLLYSSN
jgi:ATP-dependent Clp protease ATP-binding subunit ClpC